MAEKINDGGPAFPTVNENHAVGSEGISVRDYFAAAASWPWSSVVDELPCSLMSELAGEQGDRTRIEWLAAATSSWRFIIADSMLRAREVGDG